MGYVDPNPSATTDVDVEITEGDDISEGLSNQADDNEDNSKDE